jgi:hypothetical protein
MFKKSISFIIIIFVVILGTMSLVAQEAPASPLDPTANPDANACFEGGELFERCDTSDFNADGVVSQDEKDYAYVYGWYLLRCRVGGFFTEEFCATILPVAPIECVSGSLFGKSYVFTPGFNSSKEYSDSSCSGSFQSVTVVTASDRDSARVLCNSIYIGSTPFLLNAVNGTNYYICLRT